MKQILLFIGLHLFNSCCYCQSAYFKLENEDTSIIKTNDVKPFLDESVDSEMECYMKCLGDQDNCCLIEMKENAGKVNQCLLYNISPVYVNKVYEKNSKITSIVDNDCMRRKSCLEWYQKGWREDGVYKIHVNGKSVKVRCDMTTNGGGWTVVQRRFDGSVNFARQWNEYKNGFGDANEDYWLGNDLIHQLTSEAEGVLIKVKSKSLHSESKYIIHKGFKIDGEENKYKLHIGEAVDGDNYLVNNQMKGFRVNDGMYFTTSDHDNDNTLDNCATLRGGGGGFWYKTCTNVTPNSGYPPNGVCSNTNICIRWKYWKSTGTTFLKFFQMSIKSEE